MRQARAAAGDKKAASEKPLHIPRPWDENTTRERQKPTRDTDAIKRFFGA